MPGIGCYFFTFENLKSLYLTINGKDTIGNGPLLVIGGLSRFLVGTALMPINIVKVKFEVKPLN